MAIHQGYSGKSFKLVNKSGQQVEITHEVVDFRGDTEVVTSIRAPHKSCSEGHVNEFYAGVFDLKFVEVCGNCREEGELHEDNRCEVCHQVDRDIEAYQLEQEEINRCQCGSGEQAQWEYDARGIELCKACSKCRKKKLSGYRREILTGYDQSDVDEPIEPDGCYDY